MPASAKRCNNAKPFSRGHENDKRGTRTNRYAPQTKRLKPRLL
nr:hypothetical protein MZNIZDYX_MZNIZDYX_CDS_0042 [uncultured phage]